MEVFMYKDGLSRRQFLQMMASGTTAAIVASVTPLASFAQGDMMYNEAPMLADLVAAGSLPPVAERLPKNPRVVTPTEEIGQYGGTLRRALKGISDRWGPTKLNEEMAIEWDIPDPDTVNVVANYISEWTQNDDASEYTFTLRDGLKWSDGHPFTTDDVQFWYDEFYMGEIEGQEATITIGGVPMELEVIDELTYKVSFPTPNPLLPLVIAKITLGSWAGPTMAAPKHYLSQFIPHLTDDQSKIDAAIEKEGVETWQQLMGGSNAPVSGWFYNPEVPTMCAWTSVNHPSNDPWLATRNPYYHAVDPEGNQYPYIDGWTHAWFDDASVFDLWIAQGQIDAHLRHVNAANFTFYKENEEAGDYTVKLWRVASTNAFFPNISHKDPVLRAIFDDARFREALSISINRQELNDLVYEGLLEPRQASPVSGSPNFDPEFETRWTEYDPDRANALLDEMGLDKKGDDGFRLNPDGDPLVITILFTDALGGSRSDEVTLVEGYWEAIGLNINQELVERSLYESRTNNGDVDIGVWGADRNSVVMADTTRYTGAQSDGPWAPLYGQWWSNEEGAAKEEPPDGHPIKEIWRLWEATQSEADEATRNALFKQMLDIHKEHPYMIGTVGEAPSPFIVKNNVGNIPDGQINDDTLRSPGGIPPITWFFRS
jgi:peptide/nickel transport system substrate-binding protein